MISFNDQEAVIMDTVGVAATIKGSLDLVNGRIYKGALSIFLGMTSININGRIQGLYPNSSMLMKNALIAGSGAVGMQGVLHLNTRVNRQSPTEMIKGGIQVALGIGGVIFFSSLDPKIIIAAHEAFAIAMTSSFIAKRGILDVCNGCYRQGITKLLFGVGGIAGAGLYMQTACNEPLTAPSSFSEDPTSFLEAHKSEIEAIYESKEVSGNWTLLGNGMSKKVYEHKELPGVIIKIPNDEKGFRESTGEDDLRMHLTNLEKIRNIAASFDRIVLPKSIAYQTSKGLMIVEEKLNIVSAVNTLENEKNAMRQFRLFQQVTSLCDLYPLNSDPHNAGMISQSNPIKIGIIDFDCMESSNKLTSTIDNFVNDTPALLASSAMSIGNVILKMKTRNIFAIGLTLGTFLISQYAINYF